MNEKFPLKRELFIFHRKNYKKITVSGKKLAKRYSISSKIVI